MKSFEGLCKLSSEWVRWEAHTNFVQVLDKPRYILLPNAFVKRGISVFSTREEAGELIEEVG